MKVFLIGGFGFIGKRFIRQFSNIHEITVFATKQDIQNVSKTLDLTKILIEQGSVVDNNFSDIIAKNKPDVVVHLAALTGLKKCNESPEIAFEINIYGTYNVVKACLTSSCKLIFISSREVYGETIHETSREEDPLFPNNIYGLTKKIGEDVINLAGKKNNLDFTILRLTNVYGPEGEQYGAVIIIKNALYDKKIQILGGTQRLNYIYVDDVVNVINLVLKNEKSSKQVFNVGSKETVSIEEFVNKVATIVPKDVTIEHHPMRDSETLNFEPNMEKLEKILGYIPKYTLEDGIKNIIKWYEG